jgi:hypothetical protein
VFRYLKSGAGNKRPVRRQESYSVCRGGVQKLASPQNVADLKTEICLVTADSRNYRCSETDRQTVRAVFAIVHRIAELAGGNIEHILN